MSMEYSPEELARKVNRMAEIKRQQEALKAEWAELEGIFLLLSENTLRDTKYKSVAYTGTGGKLTATMSESVKNVYPSFFKDIFGKAYKDAVTETTTYKLSDPAKRMLAGLWTKQYIQMTVAQVIEQLPCDDTTKQALGKKLKGAKYETDLKNLKAIGGFDDEAAKQYAYWIAEAAVWESFQRLLKVNQKDDAAVEELLDLINGAVVVEETPKLAIELLGD